jgi:apolipoprotein D and lipocalin family protein
MPRRSLPICLMLLAVAGAATAAADLVTVPHVDLSRYVGLWHQVALIPNSFQDQCTGGTTAEYVLREDGRITVINSCDEADGSRDRAEGLARVVDTATNARLEVSFFSIFGWRPVWGDYWIIGLDADYRWAVVGTPSRKYGWVLARTSDLPEADNTAIRQVLERNGYRWDDFEVASP